MDNQSIPSIERARDQGASDRDEPFHVEVGTRSGDPIPPHIYTYVSLVFPSSFPSVPNIRFLSAFSGVGTGGRVRVNCVCVRACPPCHSPTPPQAHSTVSIIVYGRSELRNRLLFTCDLLAIRLFGSSDPSPTLMMVGRPS